MANNSGSGKWKFINAHGGNTHTKAKSRGKTQQWKPGDATPF